jgi:phosphoglycolate phosphatase
MGLVVFDCDGTLVDSQHGIVAAMAAASEAQGLSAPAVTAVRRVVGLSLDDAIRQLFPGGDTAQWEGLGQSYKAAFARLRREAGFDEPLFPGIREAVARLDEQGYLLGIATGKSMRGLTATLDRHGLADTFITLQTADRGPGKPHPGMLQRAIADAGATAAETVMVGDTTFDMAMGRNAGTAAIGVAWGYHSPDELLAAGALDVAGDCAALAELVARALRAPA